MVPDGHSELATLERPASDKCGQAAAILQLVAGRKSARPAHFLAARVQSSCVSTISDHRRPSATIGDHWRLAIGHRVSEMANRQLAVGSVRASLRFVCAAAAWRIGGAVQIGSRPARKTKAAALGARGNNANRC